MRYDDAVAALFQGPLEHFVAERKRLAGELKAAGEPAGAAKLAKLGRPPISAWVVDQLWWHERVAFDALFETAQRLRDGQLAATAAHREAIARLRAHAVQILTDAEHGTTEATLRRVTLTLSALAAAGGWDPDLPGALSADRDPPGFEAIGITSVIAPARTPPALEIVEPAGVAELVRTRPEGAEAEAEGAAPRAGATDELEAARERRAAADAERRRELEAAAEAAAELRRAEAERAKLAAERHRLAAALRTAQGDVAQREREVARLERDLSEARTMVAQAHAVVHGLEERLAQLDP